MSSLNSCQLLFVSVLMVSCALPLVHAAEGGKVFTIANDEFGPMYRVDMNKVKSAADLAAVPGVKIAWDLQGHRLSGWIWHKTQETWQGRPSRFLRTPANSWLGRVSG